MAGHEGHRQRLKDEFLARPEVFPDHKVLELLLFYANPRSDTNPTAHDLIEQFGSLAGVLDASVEDLQKVPKVGAHAATLLKTVKEISRRYLAVRTDVTGTAKCPEEYYEHLHDYFFGATTERVYLLCMDGKQKVLGVRKIAEGSVNAAVVNTRLVMEAAFSLNASRVVLAHNHVSGLAVPSAEDQVTTNRLRDLLAEVGIVLVDHLVFVDRDMVSIRASGLYQPVEC